MDALMAVDLIILVVLLVSLSITISEKRRLKKVIENVRGIGDKFEGVMNDQKEHNRVLEESFLAIEESILSELSDSINNLKAGRYEEVYNILTSLSDVVTADVVFSKEKQSVQ